MINKPAIVATVPAGTKQEKDNMLQLETAKMRLVLSPYGARLHELWLRNDDGTETNITVSLADDAAYAAQDSYIGAICGRFASRIANARYTSPDGTEFVLSANEGKTHLHGGKIGFNDHNWQAQNTSKTAIRFDLHSADGDQGYPGNFDATATYSIIADNRLRLEMTATCDQTCPVNMTNHAYWNLSGRLDKPATNHILQIDADAYLRLDDSLIPLPGRQDVTGTGYDFRNPSEIAQNMAHADQGFDHSYCLNGQRGDLRQIATLTDPDSGRGFKLFSTEPGLQLYLAQHFTNAMTAKDGTALDKFVGIALEPQAFTDAPNRPDFPSAWLNPGETYRHVIEWEFS
ncbi:aldose epimerase family protein [Thalassospira alkalitolerans]|uniref:aldose epimerase family protein n=1 Tax=Thalassospira alkalitolerans TaxID=1293890 RepID=UPI003AA940A6